MKKKNQQSNKYNLILFIFIFVLLIFFLLSVSFKKESQIDLNPTRAEEINNSDSQASSSILSFVLGDEGEDQPKRNIKYVGTPDQVKAIYMTACVVSTRNFRQDLVDLIDETEINSIIIDIKDYSGTISFNSGLEGDNGDGCRADDMPEFIETLHEKGIYVIGRVTVFQDPLYATLYPELAIQKESDKSIWSDYKGIHFIEVGAKKYWDYILDLAKKSHEIGFDEINFDYVRFPSDGNMKDIYFPFSDEIIEANPDTGKAQALEEFFIYLDKEIRDYNQDKENPLITSADLFGMVTTSNDDLNIGQVLERALPYFDYVAPMVYPSHYPAGFNGWKDPNTVAYDLISYVMTGAVEKVESLKNATSTPDEIKERVNKDQLRPWLQDFDYGGNYGPKEVRDQIRATYDVGLDSWMLWAPSNRYTRDALESN